MKRLRRSTIPSTILLSVSIFFGFLVVYTGNILLTIGVLLFFILSRVARKTESFDDYRDRYEEKYGMTDPEKENNNKGQER